MKKLLLITLLFVLNSCATNYYLVNIDEDTTIYTSENGTDSITVIPKGYAAYINTSNKKQRKIKWKKYKGWAINPVYSNASMSSNNSSNYTPNSYNNYNTSSSSGSSGSGGSVQVKGYTRKNGTYVAPHTRSAPRRR